MLESGGLHLRGSARTDKGRVRNNNEDNIYLREENPYMLAIVADGMGGAVAGEEASRIAVESIRKNVAANGKQHLSDYDEMDNMALAQQLTQFVRQANLEILTKADKSPNLKGMGTTLTMAFARGAEVILAHVGDSRAYLVHGRNGSITQLTSDHSFVQALIEAGHITDDEAEDHPMKNVLYRALGQANDIDIDINSDIRLDVSDRLVLCTDGLTLHLNPMEIAEIVWSERDPTKASEKLIAVANQRGGRDNISVIIVQSDELDNETSQFEALTVDTPDTNFTPPLSTSSVPLTSVRYHLPNQPPRKREGHDTLEPFQ